jgi:hypothetical protein
LTHQDVIRMFEEAFPNDQITISDPYMAEGLTPRVKVRIDRERDGFYPVATCCTFKCFTCNDEVGAYAKTLSESVIKAMQNALNNIKWTSVMTLNDNDRLTLTDVIPKLATTSPTKQQAKVLDFVAEYWREFDSIPSLRTISQGIGLSSSSAYSVQTHLKELVSKGWLEKVDDGWGKMVWRFPR